MHGTKKHKIHCSIILLSSLFFPLTFPTKTSYAVYPIQLIIESVTLVYVYSVKLQITKLVMQLFHHPSTSSILCPNILLSTFHHLQSRQGRQEQILNLMVESIPLI